MPVTTVYETTREAVRDARMALWGDVNMRDQPYDPVRPGKTPTVHERVAVSAAVGEVDWVIIFDNWGNVRGIRPVGGVPKSWYLPPRRKVRRVDDDGPVPRVGEVTRWIDEDFGLVLWDGSGAPTREAWDEILPCR